ncbi:MAG: hypothetical protein HY438_00745 [DPANN group archaeon]|nr:hypothetical protein [DPANN group archaeon]
MATYEKYIAAIAAVFLLANISHNFLGAGSATVKMPVDFSIRALYYPKIMLPNMHITTRAVLSNKGTQSASFVTYDYRIFDERGAEVYRSPDGSYIQVLPVDTEVSRYISTVMFQKAGKYKVRVTIDSEKQFDETDETNNIYETTITVTDSLPK